MALMDFLNISPIGFQDKVTLNIEGDSVRVMVTRGKQVTKWGSVPLSPDMIRDGLILDPIVVGSTASALLESQNISTKKAVASLSGLHSSLRILKLPSMARGMLGEAVQRESEKVMPIDLEELHLSWQDLGVEDDQHQIFVLGIPRNMMDTQIQTLQETGLQPHLMDLKPLALMRAVNRKDALIIDVEANDFDIVLVDDGLPAIMRTIFLGQDSLSPQEAADRIVAELSRTVKFYQESHEDSTLSPSTPHFLVGTLGADSQLAELIQTRVDYPIEPLTTPLKYPADFPVNQYVVNIGLALKTPPRMALIKSGPYPQPLNLNILPEMYQPPRPSLKKLALAPLIVGGVALIWPLYQLNVDAAGETAGLQAQLSTLNQRVRTKVADVRETGLSQQNIIETLAAIEALKAEHESIVSRGLPFSQPLQLIVGSLTPDVTLTTISDKGSIVGLTGKASDYLSALAYAEILRQTGKFAYVDTALVARQGATEEALVTFNINLGEYIP